MQAFNSSERSEFYKNSGFPLYDASRVVGNTKLFYPYALYTCKEVDSKLLEEISEASIGVAKVFDRVLCLMKNWDFSDFTYWAFDPRLYNAFKLPRDKFFSFRAEWGLKERQLKLLEINSQTPSFWFELEMGNKLVSQHFGFSDPTPNSEHQLNIALNQAIKNGLKTLPGTYGVTPLIGFVTCNLPDDLQVMSWLSNFCDYPCEVLSIENLDFTKRGDIPFNKKTQHAFDALIFWYPLEWAVDRHSINGESFWEVFVRSLEKKRFALIHGLSAFFLQSKAILAYITENEDQIFTGNLGQYKKYFPKTYFSSDPFGDTYFAKPIWGREGRGSYLIKTGQIKKSRLQEAYYVKQKHIYQELLELPQIEIDDKKLTCIYESWVYRVNNHFVSGGLGLRGSEHPITDDFSYWIPIGVKK